MQEVVAVESFPSALCGFVNRLEVWFLRMFSGIRADQCLTCAQKMQLTEPCLTSGALS